MSIFHPRWSLCGSPGESQSDPEIQKEIKHESMELVEKLAKLCQTFHSCLKSKEEISQETVQELFRTLHTLKGLAQMANLIPVVSMAHACEDYIELVRREVLKLNEDTVELLVDVQHVFDQVYKFFPDQSLDSDLLMELERQSFAFQEIAKLHPPDFASVEVSSNPFEKITSEEKEQFQKFFSRPEKIYGVNFTGATYKSLVEIKSGKHYDDLSRIADFILLRVHEDSALIIFSAELDQEILNSILQINIIELNKNIDLFKKLPPPWNKICFEDNQILNLEVNKEVLQESKEKSQIISEKIEEHHIDEEDSEDFDVKNLSGQNIIDIPDLDPEMLQDFLSNADELLENLSQSMLQLEENPDSKEAVESIFRSAHTIKGTSGMFGFRAIEKLTHKMENLFDRIRKGSLVVSSALMDGLFFGLDRIKSMFDAIKQNKSSEMPINDALDKLNLKHTGQPKTDHLEKEKTKLEIKLPVVEIEKTKTESPIKPTPEKKKVAEKKQGGDGEAGGTIRVDLKRLDSLVNLVGELVIDRTRFARIEEELRGSGNSELGHLMSETVLLFGRHMNEVQSIIMKIRMVPVGNAFYKFTRVVRDLCRQVNKEIDLHIVGGETELDKTLVEEIGDPLVHLIRNSVDHGIELPEDREKLGKQRKGNIHLKASQDGNMIVITIQDDGKGLQTEKIRSKAIERGIIKETDRLTNKEIFGLIFEAGFSTSDKITNISGRGVGMDVVKKSIVKLKGIIELDSELGKGTTTTIKLPLTLAIIPSLMVETKGESYAIPLVNVIESIRIKPEDVQKIGSADFVKLRDRVLPLLKLKDVFDLQMMDTLLWYRMEDIKRNKHRHSEEENQQAVPNDADVKKSQGTTNTIPKRSNSLSTSSLNFRKKHAKPRIIFVVVGVGEKRVGVIVDQLQGQQEIVIKSLGRLMGKGRGVAGGCVLGNGRVALVLDVGEIIDDFSQTKGHGVTHVAV